MTSIALRCCPIPLPPPRLPCEPSWCGPVSRIPASSAAPLRVVGSGADAGARRSSGGWIIAEDEATIRKPSALPDELWSPLGLAALALTIAVIGLLVAGLLLLVPTLQRVDHTLSLIDQSLPILEDLGPQVDRIDDNVRTLTPEVVDLGGGFSDVGSRVDGLRDPIVDLGGGIERVGGQVDGLRQPIGGIEARILELQVQIEGLRTDLAPIDELPALRRDIAPVAELGPLRQDLAATRETLGRVAGSLEQLTTDFSQVVELLEKTAFHVENLDRKTGPVVPPAAPR